MNGRIYDPTLGRFLQADPHIQAPSNSQSYNRYAYVLNNPMSYTDPSGYFFKKLAGKLLGKTGARLAGFFAGGVLGAVIGNWAFDRAMNSQGIGAVVGVALNFVPGCQVWCSALFSAQRTYYATGSLSAAFHAGGQTAAIAGVMSYIGPANTGNPAANVAVDAVIGGTFSELTGGKFKNGAATAAFFSAVSQDWSSNRGQFNNNADVEKGYSQSVEKYGSQDASIQLSSDLSLDYTVSGPDGFAEDVGSYMASLRKTTTGRQALIGIAESGNSLAIFQNIGQSAATGRGFWDFSWDGTTIALDPRSVRAPVGLFQTISGRGVQPWISSQHALGHELIHAWQNTSWTNGAPYISHSISGSSPWETQATAYTNLIRQQQGYRYRRVRYD